MADDGTVHGLEDDYATFTKRGERGDQDLWGQHLQNLIRSRLGDSALALVTWQFHTINGDHLARVSIDPANHPVHERKGDQQIFWLRTPTSTIAVTTPRTRPNHRPPLAGATGGPLNGAFRTLPSGCKLPNARWRLASRL